MTLFTKNMVHTLYMIQFSSKYSLSNGDVIFLIVFMNQMLLAKFPLSNVNVVLILTLKLNND